MESSLRTGKRYRNFALWICLLLILAFMQACSIFSGSAMPGTSLHLYTQKPQGLLRTYYVHAPKRYDGSRRLPLVVFLHGAYSSAEEMEMTTGLSDLADRNDFFVAYPNGIGLFGFFRHWNAGFCCGKAMWDDLDDATFVHDIIADVARQWLVDLNKVYLIGYSNGGMLAYATAAKRPELFAAVAVVSGTAGASLDAESPMTQVQPQGEPAPLFVFHGVNDDVIPFGGGAGVANSNRSYLSALRSIETWLAHNKCGDDARSARIALNAELKTWCGDDDSREVRLLSVTGWKHAWPSQEAMRLHYGSTAEEANLDVLGEVWSFLDRHERASTH